MPYDWKNPQPPAPAELHLWPHQSLRPEGFVVFIGVTAGMLVLPLFPVLGTFVFWGLLPFLAVAIGGVWYALKRSWNDRRIHEVLTLSANDARLTRKNPDGQVQEWTCNRYWAIPELHASGGPVPNYVTLRGAGREVEIGAFLSEEERLSLYRDLLSRMRG